MKGKKLKIHGAPIPTPTPLIPYQMDAYPNHTSEFHGLQLQQIHQKTGGIKLPDGDFPKVQLQPWNHANEEKMQNKELTNGDDME